MASSALPSTTAFVRRSAPLWAVLAAVLALTAGCSSGDDKKAVGPAQYVDSTTTAPPTAPATAPDGSSSAPSTPTTSSSSPSFVEDHAGAEADNHDHIEAEVNDLEGFVATPPAAAEPSDPKQVALAWGCGYRAKPAGEGTDAWVARLAPMMTERAAAKMSAMSSPAEPGSEVVRPLGAVEIEPATDARGPMWRVNCDVKILDAAGNLVADGAVAPVMVVLADTGSGWLVDDFSYGGIRFDG